MSYYTFMTEYLFHLKLFCYKVIRDVQMRRKLFALFIFLILITGPIYVNGKNSINFVNVQRYCVRNYEFDFTKHNLPDNLYNDDGVNIEYSDDGIILTMKHNRNQFLGVYINKKVNYIEITSTIKTITSSDYIDYFTGYSPYFNNVKPYIRFGIGWKTLMLGSSAGISDSNLNKKTQYKLGNSIEYNKFYTYKIVVIGGKIFKCYLNNALIIETSTNNIYNNVGFAGLILDLDSGDKIVVKNLLIRFSNITRII